MNKHGTELMKGGTATWGAQLRHAIPATPEWCAEVEGMVCRPDELVRQAAG